MKKLNHTNLMILTLLVCLSFGCIFGSKEKTPIISPPTATPIPTAIPITNIQENTSLSITKSEDSILPLECNINPVSPSSNSPPNPFVGGIVLI